MHTYPHFENDFKEANLQYWLRTFPELKYKVYIIEEKIHGSNFQISVSPGLGMYTLASRKRIIPDSEDFHSIRRMIQEDARLLPVLTALHAYSDSMSDEVTIYGEVFGPGVTPKNGPYYGETKNIRFFNIRVGESMCSTLAFHKFLNGYNLGGFTPSIAIPDFGYADSLKEALEFDVERNSIVPPKPELVAFNNLIEGVVIKPYDKVYVDSIGKTFFLKKKNKQYLEKTAPSKEIRKENPTVTSLRTILLDEYLNQNRIDSVFSKEGIITSDAQIGNYIKLIIEDMREDFSASDDARLLVSLDDKDTKQVFNIGKNIVPYLKDAMSEKED